MTFAIAGVSGHTGKVAAETLLNAGKHVRVIVRDALKGEAWKARGAEVAIADLNDAGALAKALTGVEGAYLLIPPHMTAPDFGAYQDGVTAALATAIAQSRVPHIVLLSSVGAQHATGTGPIAGLHRAEKAFGKIATSTFTFVRAGYFMENLASSLGMLAQGVLPSFTPANIAIPMIATVDIGRTVAQALIEGAKQNQIIELGGPDRTINDVAATLSKITGKNIAVHEGPLEAMVPTLTGFGMSTSLAKAYEEMTSGLISGHVAFEGNHRRVLGTTELTKVLGGILRGA